MFFNVQKEACDELLCSSHYCLFVLLVWSMLQDSSGLGQISVYQDVKVQVLLDTPNYERCYIPGFWHLVAHFLTAHSYWTWKRYRDLVRRVSGDNCEFALPTTGNSGSCFTWVERRTRWQVVWLSPPVWGTQWPLSDLGPSKRLAKVEIA